uniref:M20 metallopeptidase family protein n=1 Tax=Muricomes intestini TaxID=1796634 RepID=UPI002FDF8D89
MKSYELALAEKQYIIGLRRHFHSHPELSWQEYATTKKICEELDKLSIPYKKLPKTGVIATLEGTKKHPVIGLRADIDALPIKEVKDLTFKSLNEGVMHACGHDSHMSMLLGAAKILSEHKEELNCTVRFIFQPAEETIQGARTLLNNAEVMECDNLFAIHIFPYIATGKISVEEGPRFTSADTIKFKIMGRGGHGSMPQDTVDPIVASAAVINDLQSIVSREIDPRDTCVISVCSIHAGSAANIIPNNVEMLGTVRTFNPKVREILP